MSVQTRWKDTWRSAACLLALAGSLAGGQADTAALGPKVLPSLVTLAIQTRDGKTAVANAVLVVKDGVAATVWHQVRDAVRVTARFSNGDEYECSGVIDKDEKRNVALLRIKIFGRPVLKMEAAEPAPGVALAAAVVKDSAFGVVVVKAGEALPIDGVRAVRLDGDIPEGNAGSPVVNAGGDVVGLLAGVHLDGRSFNVALPAAYILGLDASLPTQPWGGSPSPASGGQAAGQGRSAESALADEEIDTRLGQALLTFSEDRTARLILARSSKGYGYLNGVPQALYGSQQTLQASLGRLAETQPADPLRQRLVKAAVQVIKTQLSATEIYIQAIVVGQAAKDWNAQAKDLEKRGDALAGEAGVQLGAIKDDLAVLEQASAKFREFLPREQRCQLGMAPRPSGFGLGVFVYAGDPLRVAYIIWQSEYGNTLGYKLGLRGGDKIISAGEKRFTAENDFEDFKLFLKDKLGQTLPAVVERDGKEKAIKLKIPKEIPKDALINP